MMSYVAGASAAAAAIANAVKASGAIIEVSEEDFKNILSRADEPLVVCASSKFLKTTFQYLTSFKGFFFFTKTREPLALSSKWDIINAGKIWIPG